ncbi:oligosaccharide flippase family protein [Xenorhabdus griffiniae]|uniref:Oligosaccharide flippase family protein n=3 Tax=Xenorhabdus griffiniae TaxID=351672 RepID=A0ABY9XHV7_9GAMM|nr:oligosaccharide flippase family protein [Xenorhabdus griffiniae]MBD1228153.1 oligosaccharide flippase family protein [Xenorhabdus griffiniae]WNH02086.1 oligosaccharide flippase family protein [Xenorhabdus griffiniae]
MITLLSMPLITRLYSPTEFGILAIFMMLTTILSSVSSLRYELAINLCNNKDKSKVVLFLTTVIYVSFTVLISIPSLFYSKEISIYLGNEKLSDYLFLIPILLILVNFNRVLTYWVLRNKDFSLIARIKISQSISQILIQIFGFRLGVLGLIIGYFSSQIFGVYTLFKYALKTKAYIIPKKKQIVWAIIKYKNFPIYSTWATLLDNFSGKIPILLLTILYNPYYAGLYAFADKILLAPITLVGQSIGNVFYAEASQVKNNTNLSKLALQVFNILVQVISPLLVLLFLTAPILFNLLFGEKWEEAGYYFRYLSPLFFLLFVFTPISNIYYILNKQKQWGYFQILLLVSGVLFIFIGHTTSNIDTSIILFSISQSFCWLLIIDYIFSVLNIQRKIYLHMFFSNFLISLLITLPATIGFLYSNKDFHVPLLIGICISLLLILFKNRKLIWKKNHEKII